MIEIPLNSNPEQLFSITLQGEKYDCRVIWNFRWGVWTISFSQGGEVLHNGIPIVSGVDLTKQYNFPIRNMYAVNLSNPDIDATDSNLGSSAKLFILEDGDLDNA
jgi:hypothetical protein